MNKAEQRMFIRQLMNNIKKDLLQEVKDYPEGWDGFELRLRVRDAARTAMMFDVKSYPYNKRYKDYNNEVLVRNLIG